MRINRILLLFCLVGLLCACSGKKNAKKDYAERAIGVKVERVSEVASERRVSYVGTAEAVGSALINSPAPGRVIEIDVKRGERVRKDQVIARIESQNVRSTWEIAKANLEQAEDGHRRASSVYESGSISEVQMVEINTKLSQARASMDAAQKALDDCSIKAPFDGYVSEIMTNEGVSVGILDPIMRIMDLSEIIIRFAVPESEINELHLGQEVLLDVAATSQEGLKGKIRSKGVSASPLSHSYDCTAELHEMAPGLMPGMVCKVYIDEESEGSVEIPAAIVQTGTQGQYVWIVKDGKAQKREVVVGSFSGKGVIVNEGLHQGDSVIVEGYQKVSSEMKLRVID